MCQCISIFLNWLHEGSDRCCCYILICYCILTSFVLKAWFCSSELGSWKVSSVYVDSLLPDGMRPTGKRRRMSWGGFHRFRLISSLPLRNASWQGVHITSFDWQRASWKLLSQGQKDCERLICIPVELRCRIAVSNDLQSQLICLYTCTPVYNKHDNRDNVGLEQQSSHITTSPQICNSKISGILRHTTL